MPSAKLRGKVQKILWSDGLQAYEFINGKPEIYAPSVDLFSVDFLGEDLYIFSTKKIGSHYKLNNPAWELSETEFLESEFSESELASARLVAKEVTKIDERGKGSFETKRSGFG